MSSGDSTLSSYAVALDWLNLHAVSPFPLQQFKRALLLDLESSRLLLQHIRDVRPMWKHSLPATARQRHFLYVGDLRPRVCKDLRRMGKLLIPLIDAEVHKCRFYRSDSITTLALLGQTRTVLRELVAEIDSLPDDRPSPEVFKRGTGVFYSDVDYDRRRRPGTFYRASKPNTPSIFQAPRQAASTTRDEWKTSHAPNEHQPPRRVEESKQRTATSFEDLDEWIMSYAVEANVPNEHQPALKLDKSKQRPATCTARDEWKTSHAPLEKNQPSRKQQDSKRTTALLNGNRPSTLYYRASTQPVCTPSNVFQAQAVSMKRPESVPALVTLTPLNSAPNSPRGPVSHISIQRIDQSSRLHARQASCQIV